jgi:hypothetical protein
MNVYWVCVACPLNEGLPPLLLAKGVEGIHVLMFVKSWCRVGGEVIHPRCYRLIMVTAWLLLLLLPSHA